MAPRTRTAGQASGPARQAPARRRLSDGYFLV